MARVDVDGLDSLIADLDALSQIPGGVIDDMLNDGADVIVDEQQAEIQRQWRGPYSLGISAESVKKGKVKICEDGRVIHIYPQGTRTRGKQKVRNGEIAFLNEYGAPSRGIAARPAIGTATKKKEQEAVEAGEKVYHAYLDSKNL